LTDRVKGRVLLVEGLSPEARRRVLTQALAHESVMDGVVQGSMLRLVKRNGADTPAPVQLGIPDAGSIANASAIRIKPTQPRFEDAFIDILGGGPGGHSLLAERMPPVADDGAPVVAAEGLTKRFGSFTAVSDNSFKIHRGEIFGLLGPNGAGKSTTFKMMCGLLEPTEGHGEILALW
jgi:ABC-2 type transport system ATP-binding protein